MSLTNRSFGHCPAEPLILLLLLLKVSFHFKQIPFLYNVMDTADHIQHHESEAPPYAMMSKPPCFTLYPALNPMFKAGYLIDKEKIYSQNTGR